VIFGTTWIWKLSKSVTTEQSPDFYRPVSDQGRLLHWSMDAACVLEKNEGGTKIMHIFVKIGGEEKLKGEERLNCLNTYLHRFPLIFSKIFSLAPLARLHFIFIPHSGDAEHNYTAGTVKSVSLLKVGRKSVNFPTHFWWPDVTKLITQNLN